MVSELLIRQLRPISEYLDAINSHIPSDVDLSPNQITNLSRSNPELFAKKYFFKNLVKCAVTSVRYQKEINRHKYIYDFGSGPGTFLFPFQKLFKPVQLIAIDQSKEALVLGKHLFAVSGMKTPSALQMNLPSEVISINGLVTASYFVTELDDRQYSDFTDLILASNSTEFLVVDYQHVISRIVADILPKRYVRSDMFSVRLPVRLAKFLGDESISFGVAFVPSS